MSQDIEDQDVDLVIALALAPTARVKANTFEQDKRAAEARRAAALQRVETQRSQLGRPTPTTGTTAAANGAARTPGRSTSEVVPRLFGAILSSIIPWFISICLFYGLLYVITAVQGATPPDQASWGKVVIPTSYVVIAVVIVGITYRD